MTSLIANGYEHQQQCQQAHSEEAGAPDRAQEADNADPAASAEPKVDRYGFLVTTDSMFHRRLEVSAAVEQQRRAKEAERERKWVDMLRRWKAITAGNNAWDLAMLNRRVRKGVPDSLRGLVWGLFLHTAVVRARYGPPPSAATIAASLPAIVIEDIAKDIDRTYPLHVMFMAKSPNAAIDACSGSGGDAVGNGSIAAEARARAEGGEQEQDAASSSGSGKSPRRGGGQADLRLLLERYAVIDPQTGYCQGMSFVAAFLLSYMPPEEAHYAFVSLMLEAPFPLRALYQPDMLEMQRVLHVFGRLGGRYLGRLWAHLEEQGMHPSMYATEWFMTIYCRGFSFDLATRVFDVFVREGSCKILYRVALGLLKSLEAELLAGSFEDIMGTLRGVAERVDADNVLRIALAIPLRTYYVRKYEAEFDVQHAAKQAEKQRRQEQGEA